MNDLGLWFGFIGIIVGALVTFVAEVIVRKSQMRFDMSIVVRETLLDMNKKLGEMHQDILLFYIECDRKKVVENIMSLKSLHKKVMEIYKDFKIHFGDLKAYELNSAIYQYLYELAHENQTKQVKIHKLEFSDFKDAYVALKDCMGLMINHIRFDLVKINSIKKMTRKDKVYRQNEYVKYAERIIDFLKREDIKELFETFIKVKDNVELLYSAQDTLIKRVAPFYQEFPTSKRDKDLPRYIEKTKEITPIKV